MRLLGLPIALLILGYGCAEQSNGDVSDPEMGGKGGNSSGGSAGKGGSGSTGKGGTTSTGKGGSGSGGTTSKGGTSGTSGTSGEAGETSNGGTASAGTAGTGGTGGTGNTGAGGEGGEGPVIGAGGGCALPDAPIEGVSVRYQSEHNGASEFYIGSVIKIYNTGPNTLDIGDLTVRYYFTNEVAPAVLQEMTNWAWLRDEGTALQGNLSFQVVDALDCGVAGATDYIDFDFDGGAGTLAPNHYIEFSWQLGNSASQSFDQSNDYSFSVGQVQADDYAKVVLLNASGVVWGDPP